MLLAEDLFNELNKEVFTKSLGSPENYKKVICDTITKYICDNAIVNGIFSGVIPGVPPTPLVAPATGHFECTPFEMPFGTNGGMNPWLVVMFGLFVINFKVILNAPAVGTGTIVVSQPVPAIPPTSVNDIKTIWMPVCTAIVQTLQTVTVVPVISATYTAAVGTFSYTNIT